LAKKQSTKLNNYGLRFDKYKKGRKLAVIRIKKHNLDD